MTQIHVPKMLVALGLVSSVTQATRLCKQGAVQIFDADKQQVFPTMEPKKQSSPHD